MADFTYTPLTGFYISVEAPKGNSSTMQQMPNAYLVGNTGVDYISLVVHTKRYDSRWFVSEESTGGAIRIAPAPDRETAVARAIDVIEKLGKTKALARLKRVQAGTGMKFTPDPPTEADTDEHAPFN